MSESQRSEAIKSLLQGILSSDILQNIILYDYDLSTEEEKLLNKYRKLLAIVSYWIQESDHVLIVAAAGMSIGSGINYGSEEDFKKFYPGMLQYGYTTAYQCMALRYEVTMDIAWGYLADHIANMTFANIPHRGYYDLLDLCRNKDYFVLTSNVDGLFEKTGFKKDNIYTPQGDYRFLQCPTPCHRDLYDSKPIIDRIRPLIEKKKVKPFHFQKFLNVPNVKNT